MSSCALGFGTHCGEVPTGRGLGAGRNADYRHCFEYNLRCNLRVAWRIFALHWLERFSMPGEGGDSSWPDGVMGVAK